MRHAERGGVMTYKGGGRQARIPFGRGASGLHTEQRGVEV